MEEQTNLPDCLLNKIDQEKFTKWLRRKAKSLVKRDRKRNMECDVEIYRNMIYQAIIRSEGKDEYTGEELRWDLVGTYNNELSKEGSYIYKAGLALLPTIDHAEASATVASFKICSWRTNDSKHDLRVDDFLELCQRILEHANYKVQKP